MELSKGIFAAGGGSTEFGLKYVTFPKWLFVMMALGGLLVFGNLRDTNYFLDVYLIKIVLYKPNTRSLLSGYF